MIQQLLDEVAIAGSELEQELEKYSQATAIPQQHSFVVIARGFWDTCHDAIGHINKGFATTLSTALLMGQRLHWAKETLTQRGAYGEFRSQLEIPIGVARQYLALYRVFGSFPIEKIVLIASATNIFALTNKKYKDIVEALLAMPVIIKDQVQQLVKDFQKQIKAEKVKKQVEPKNTTIVQKHFDKDGAAYYTLKSIELNLSEKTGVALAAKLETQNLGQVLATVVEEPRNTIAIAVHEQTVAELHSRYQQEKAEIVSELYEGQMQMQHEIRSLKQQVTTLIQTQASTEIQFIEEEIQFSPLEIANKMLLCQTWVELVELVEKVANLVDRKKEDIFGIAVNLLAIEKRGVLIELLAEHKRKYPRDQWSWNWLPKQVRSLKEKAFALAAN